MGKRGRGRKFGEENKDLKKIIGVGEEYQVVGNFIHPCVQVFSFDLACRTGPLPNKQTDKQKFTALNNGTCSAIFMWWDCYTDPGMYIFLFVAFFRL